MNIFEKISGLKILKKSKKSNDLNYDQLEIKSRIQELNNQCDTLAIKIALEKVSNKLTYPYF